MPIFLLPEFIVDLQSHMNPHFARHVLRKTIHADGTFRPDSDDHRFKGIDEAWIRYVSTRRSAFRVIYLRFGDDIYLFRAGEHSIEKQSTSPSTGSVDAALPVTKGGEDVAAIIEAMPAQDASHAMPPPPNRFRRNVVSHPQINREIFTRRNLPHKDIWIVAPFVDANLLQPTAIFGKLLLDQVEDGASVVIITTLPQDKNIEWMEKLAENGIGVYVYPRLHSKLYCFIFDDNRRYERGLRDGDRYSSLILLGSANLTAVGMNVGVSKCNEELCYTVSEDEVGYVEDYVADLMMRGYEMPEVRRYLARGQWHKLENEKW